MRSSSPLVEVERAQPWLGTRVAIRVAARDDDAANAAVTAAFFRVAALHERMSFHQAGSELSRLNRLASREAVAVHADTLAVLRLALAIAQASHGAFDPTIAPVLVAAGRLPAPVDAPAPDPHANWRDVAIDAEGRVTFRRPLWLDLGGIAKGYAVDAAVDVLRNARIATGRVDAGGDLRVFGARTEHVVLRDFAPRDGHVAAVELCDAALAASSSRPDDAHSGAQVEAASRRLMATPRSVCVIAPQCAVADALTKAVLADPVAAQRALALYEAQAYAG